MTRFMPRSLPASTAALTLDCSPEMMIWPGALKFAASISKSAQSWETSSRVSPITAAIPPVVCSHASCMSRPRSATILRPVSKSKTPAAQYAVSSPKLRPNAAVTSSSLPCSFRIACKASPCANKAGWQTDVLVSSSSGPAKDSLLNSQPKTESAWA